MAAAIPEFNPLRHPICFSMPRWIRPSAWLEHIPFAMWIVDVMKPRVIVELGTQYGVSYCAFCQAVDELNLDTRCYAIDTWMGDPQTGFYEPDVLADLRTHHDVLYSSFSRLIQSTFDEALCHFEDASIDLLHIDGYHTYEAVKHDFESWLPKMSPHGIILFHDINVREKDFGAWKLWSEVKERYPHFDFMHCHGLGVLVVGHEMPDDLRALVTAHDAERAIIRKFFAILGTRITGQTHGQREESCATDLASVLQQKEAQIASLERQLQQKEAQIASLER